MSRGLLPHPGEILKPYFEQIKLEKPQYSMRALARDVKMSAAFVSQIFSGRRSPSLSAAESFARVLKVRRADRLILRKSIVLHSREGKDAGKILKEYISRDPAALAFKKYGRKSHESLQMLTKWYHLALMELITCTGFQSDERLIAQKLQISLSELRESLFTLVNAGLIERVNGEWRKKTLHLDFPSDTTTEATAQYHRTMTGKALEVLSAKSQPADVSRRRVIGSTVAVNPKNLERAMEELDSFLFKLSSLLCEGDCNEVYQVNLQLFPLTKEGK